MRIVDVRCTNVFVPYREPFSPYVGSRGPGEGTRGPASLLVEVATDDGISGWGEAKGEARPDLADLIRSERPFDIERILERLRVANVSRRQRSGVEMALWDIIGKASGQPVCDLLGGRYRTRVELCACQGINEPALSGEIAGLAVREWGFRTLKTKAGLDPEQDAAIIRAMRAAVGPDVALRPDANSAYSVERAKQLLPAYREAAVQYAEDPCQADDLQAWAALRREFAVPLALNMSIAALEDALRLVQHRDAADVWLPDPLEAGGMWEVKKVGALAQALGIKCGMHCSHDLGIKTAAVVHVAASTPSFTLACDSLYHALTDDVLTERLSIVEGAIAVPAAPGLGVEVDPEKVARYAQPRP